MFDHRRPITQILNTDDKLAFGTPRQMLGREPDSYMPPRPFGGKGGRGGPQGHHHSHAHDDRAARPAHHLYRVPGAHGRI